MRAILSALALLAAVGPASAATFTTERLTDGRSAVRISGDIVPGDDRAFNQIEVKEPRPAAVVLVSDGGNMDAAMRIGMVVRWLELETIVPERATCASACAIIWASGTRMAVGEGAHIGFHGAYLPNQTAPQRDRAGSALMAIYLARWGYGAAAIDFMTSAAPDRMAWLTPYDAARFRLPIVAMPRAPAPVVTPHTLDLDDPSKVLRPSVE